MNKKNKSQNEDKNSISENLSAKIKRVFIELPDFYYYHGPSETGNVDRRFIGRDRIREKFKSILSDSETKSGAYLVSGYRGMGKTSFVSKVLDDITAIQIYPYRLNRFIGLIILLIFIGLIPRLCFHDIPYYNKIIILLSGICFPSLCYLIVKGYARYFRKKYFHINLLRRFANKAIKSKNVAMTRADLVLIDICIYSSIWLISVLFYSKNDLHIYTFLNNCAILTLLVIVVINFLNLISDAILDKKKLRKSTGEKWIKHIFNRFGIILKLIGSQIKDIIQKFIEHSNHIHIKINLGYSNLTEIDILRLLARSIVTKYKGHRQKFGLKKLFRLVLFLLFFGIANLFYTFDSFITYNKSLSESLFIYKIFPTQQVLFLHRNDNLVNKIQAELNRQGNLNDESFYYVYNKIGSDFNAITTYQDNCRETLEKQIIDKYSRKKQQLYIESISSIISVLHAPLYLKKGKSESIVNKDTLKYFDITKIDGFGLDNKCLKIFNKNNLKDTFKIFINDEDTLNILKKCIADFETLKFLTIDKYIRTICGNTLAIGSERDFPVLLNSLILKPDSIKNNPNPNPDPSNQSLLSIYNSIYRQKDNVLLNPDILEFTNVLLSDWPQLCSIYLKYNQYNGVEKFVLQTIKQVDIFIYKGYKTILKFPLFNWFSNLGMIPVSISYLFILYLIIGWHLIFLLLRISSLRRPRQKNTIRKLKELNILIDSSLTIENNIGINTQNFSFGFKKNKSFPRADEREIEKRLIEVIDDFGNFPMFEYTAEFTFIFDELDKIEPLIETGEKQKNGKSNKQSFDGSRQRQQAIYELLSNLKYFLSTAKAKFIFIAGREMFDAALADISDRNYSIGSIFHDVIYLDSFLTDVHDGVGKHKITSRIEEYVCNRIIPEYFEPKEERNLKLYNKYLIDTFDDEFDETKSKETNGNEGIIIKQKREKIIYLLQHFITYLTHVSKGAPHKLTTYFENFVVRKPAKEQITNGSLYVAKKWNSHFLFFNYWDQYYIGIINNLLTPINLSINRDIKDYEDKLIVSMSFFYDHLFKFHRNAFSWRNIESTPELIDVNKNPELRSYISNIVNLLLKTHLEEIINGQYDLKFPKKVSQEMTFLSRVSAEASASFNFTLDESLALKQLYRDRLSEILSNNQGNKGDYYYDISSLCITLGDLHFFDDEYGEAITYYLEAIHPIRNKKVEEFTVTEMSLLTRNMLKMGYANERRKAYDFAFITHCEMSDKIISFFTNILHRNEKNDIYSQKYSREFALSALENIRFFYQPFLAKLQLIEKTSLDGITTIDIKRIENEFTLLTNDLNNQNSTLLFNEKKVLYSEFWNKLGDILYFKNGKINVRKKDKECLWLCGKNYQDSACYKACDSCHYYFESFRLIGQKFNIQKENAHCITKVLMIIDTINNAGISCTVENGNISKKEDIKALALTLSDIVDAYLSCTTQNELDLDRVKEFISAFDLHEVKNRIVDIPENESDSEKNIDVASFFINEKEPIKIIIKYFSQLETVIILLYLTAWLYRKTGDHKNHSYQLVKILHLLKHYFDINPDYIKKIPQNNYLEIIKKLFVDKAIGGFYCAHDHVHNYETDEFKDIFDSNYNNLLHEHISLNRISINSDLNEGLFIFYQIELMLNTDEIKDINLIDLYSLCNPYTLNTNMYNRIIKLEYRLALNSKLFSNLEIKERSSHEIDNHIAILRKFKELILESNSQIFSSVHKFELIEFLISDSIFCCFEILKLCKIFGMSYGINYSIIAKAHEELWKWSEYLNYYIYLYEVFKTNVELKEKNKIKEEIRKTIKNKLNIHSEIGENIIDEFILLDDDVRILNEIDFFKGCTIMNKIGSLIENDNIPFITPHYQCEKAIRAYYSVIETHSEGEAYKNFIENMYFLNDDFNDKYYHFHAALERFAIHMGHIKKRISVLKERMRNSETYNSNNYLETKTKK